MSARSDAHRKTDVEETTSLPPTQSGRARRIRALRLRPARTSEGGWLRAVRVLAVVGALGLAQVLAQPAYAEEAVDVVFVLDNSGSMRVNDPAFLTRRAVRNFATALSEDESIDGRIAIVLFDERARLAQPLAPASDILVGDGFAEALAELDFSGQRTNSPDGIERAIYELRDNGREEARQAIVFLTDGRIDTGDRQGDREAARWLREDLAGESEAKGIRIFGIAFTDDADYQLMQELARRTSARYYRAFEASEIPTVVEDILANVDDTPVYDLAYADSDADAEPTPAVSAAPIDRESTPGRGFGLVGWLPLALLLVGGALYYRQNRQNRRSRQSGPKRLRFGGGLGDTSAPPALLLDPGGQLGDADASIPLSNTRTTIGRDPKNDIVLADDTISSEHAIIEVREGRYWLLDRRSTNGTKLGDRRLAADERVPLKGGDRIRLADVDLMFVVEGYVPGGATVYLSSSTTPPADWSRLAESTDASPEPPPAEAEEAESQAEEVEEEVEEEEKVESAQAREHEVGTSDAPSGEVVFAEQRERLDPASILDLDEELGGEAAAPSDDEVGPDPVGEDTQDREAMARAEAVLASLADPASEADAAPDTHDTPDAPVEEKESEPDTEPSLALLPAVEDEPAPTPPATDDDPTAEIELDRLVRAREAHESESEETPEEGLRIGVGPLRECLDFHLERVSEISPAFAEFVEGAFEEELRGALPVAAGDLLAAANRSGRIEQREYTLDRVRYLILGVPAPMEAAQQLFVDSFGGFTRVLAEKLQAESFRADRCEILAVLSFGASEQPWVSLTIVPDEGQDPRIDLLSYEFLTEQERQEIEPTVDPEISQSGLA